MNIICFYLFLFSFPFFLLFPFFLNLILHMPILLQSVAYSTGFFGLGWAGILLIKYQGKYFLCLCASAIHHFPYISSLVKHKAFKSRLQNMNSHNSLKLIWVPYLGTFYLASKLMLGKWWIFSHHIHSSIEAYSTNQQTLCITSQIPSILLFSYSFCAYSRRKFIIDALHAQFHVDWMLHHSRSALWKFLHTLKKAEKNGKKTSSKSIFKLNQKDEETEEITWLFW